MKHLIHEIKRVFENERKLHIVLENYSVHHAGLLESIAIILNINLTFFTANSPDLNPIEDLWDSCKEKIKKVM